MRKTIIAIVAFLLLGLVFSCRQHQYPHILMTADSLCEVQPDSALSLLRRLRPQFASGNKADQMYYQLLCVKANDKNFIPHESDSTILSLVDYYKTKGDKKRLTEAYFYAGSVYRDLNDAPEQLKYMQLSLEVMPDDYPLHKRMLAHYQIGRLFILQDLDEEAIPSFREAIKLCKLDNDTVSLIHCLRDEAFAWESINKNDSALKNCTNALRLARTISDDKLEESIQMQLAANLNRKGEHKKALEMIRPILKRKIAKQDISACFSIVTRIFEDNELEDSALVFYQKLQYEGNLLARKLANQKLTGHYLKTKKKKKAYQHLVAFDIILDSINSINASEIVERMHSLYNYQLREKKNLELSLINKNKTNIIVVSMLVILLLIAVCIILWLHGRKRKIEFSHGLEKLKRLKEENARLSDVVIAGNKAKIERLRIRMSQLGNENFRLKHLLDIQAKKLTALVNDAEEQKEIKQQTEDLLSASLLYQLVNEQLKNEKPLKQEHWDLIEMEINEILPDFKERLTNLLKFSVHEYHICMLIKANIKTNEIAILTSRTKQAISTAKARMYQKAFKTKGTAEEWEATILAI